MVGKSLVIFFLAAFIVSCDGCDSGKLVRTCPGTDVVVDDIALVTDSDGDGFPPCAGDCDDARSSVYPGAPEVCDGLDNDCDGIIDAFSRTCRGGRLRAFDEVNESTTCKLGVSVCSSGVWGDCMGPVGPELEVCDGLDNDCDGDVDEPEVQACGPGLMGSCHPGTRICVGNETLCIDASYPQAETCDGADNDCDGVIDEGLVRQCNSVCGRGLETCKAGAWVDCDALQPELETCDGLDNDCNGLVDDGIQCTCAWGPDPRDRDVAFCVAGAVTCGLGIQECQMDGTWGACMPFGLAPETCDGWDNDCDGTIDEFSEQCGDAVHAGVGVCMLGNRECSAGAWSACTGAISPTEEQCDGLDNDCDGDVDEDLEPHDRVDVVFAADGSGSMCSRIAALHAGLSKYAADFRGTPHRFGLGVFPAISWFLGGTSPAMDIITPPVDIDAFLAVLATYQCNRGGVEPAYDAAWLMMSPNDPLGIGWRTQTGTVSGAYPYIIIVGDEVPNQGIYTENAVAQEANDCAVGACSPGDRFETFVVTDTALFLLWDAPTFNDTYRLAPIDPPDGDRYADVFRSFFRNVCR